MDIQSAIMKIIEKEGIQQKTIASRMGITPACLWGRIKASTDMTFNKAHQVLKVMDYKIVVMSQDVKIKSDWYVIDEVKADDVK